MFNLTTFENEIRMEYKNNVFHELLRPGFFLNQYGLPLIRMDS